MNWGAVRNAQFLCVCFWLPFFIFFYCMVFVYTIFYIYKEPFIAENPQHL